MKLTEIFRTHRMGIINMLLVLLAVCLGADAGMAMADATGAINDEKGNPTQLPDTPASATQIREGDLADPEIDSLIAKFRPYKWPLDTDIRLEAQQRKANGYEIEHYASAAQVLDFVTTGELTNDSAKEATVKLTVGTDALKTMAKDMLLYFPEIACYDEKGGEDGKGLVCQITEKTSSEIKIEAINGPLKDGSSGDMYVPNIASGSKVIILSNAMAESQMICAPNNYQPRKRTVYLQKTGCNIVLTDEWKKIAKKVPFVEQDLRDDALYTFRRANARTNWVGKQSRRKVYQGETMHDEFVYTKEGVLRQITSLYGIQEALTFEDLIRLTKMQFTEFSMSNTARAYCGKNFNEKLLNIDFTKHHDVTFTSRMELGIDIKSFKTTFGTLEFVYDPTLDDIGYEDYCAIIDIKNAVRYVKESGKDYTVDMKKGVGENREATRDIHIESECLALRGFNAILVGPSDALMGRAGTKATIKFTKSSTVPTEDLSDGMIVLLTAKDGEWEKDDVIVYDAGTKTWSAYSGEIVA